jgi:hypothetical protein
MSDESACIHEAAHAVVGYLLGEKPHTLTVLSFGDATTLSHVLRDHDPQDRMVVLLAGRAAEALFGFDLDPRDSHHDQRVARGMALRVAHWPAVDDDAGIPTADWIIRHAERRAEQLVSDNRDAIASVATALRRNGGRLGGREVDDALTAAFGRSPDPVATAGIPTDLELAQSLAKLHGGRDANWRLRVELAHLGTRGRTGPRGVALVSGRRLPQGGQ